MPKIRVYCVGIHFRHHIDFKPTPNLKVGATEYMSGADILAACHATWGLRYSLSSKPPAAIPGHIEYVGYTPNAANDNNAKDPGSAPRVTFAKFGAVFPFFGQPLSLTEILAPIGQPSQVLQYGVYSLDGTTIPKLFIPGPPEPGEIPGQIGPYNDTRSSFGTIGIPADSEVRIRSLNIYCTY